MTAPENRVHATIGRGFVPSSSARALFTAAVSLASGKPVDQCGQRIAVFRRRAFVFAQLYPGKQFEPGRLLLSCLTDGTPNRSVSDLHLTTCTGDRGLDHEQLRQIHALIVRGCELQRFPELRIGCVPVAGEHECFRGIPQVLAPTRQHPEPNVFLVGLSNPPMALARLSHSSVRPATKPLPCGSALRDREPVDKRLHLVGKCCDTLGVAQPHLQEGVEPDGDHPRYRLSQLLARAHTPAACVRAPAGQSQGEATAC